MSRKVGDWQRANSLKHRNLTCPSPNRSFVVTLSVKVATEYFGEPTIPLI